MTEFRPSRFEILPTIIKNLLIINGLVFLAQYTLGKNPANAVVLDDLFALHAWQSSLFRPWQLITHMFMHGGIWHIIGNMFALWMFGSILENLWGSKRFLVFYFVCGLGAAFIHLLFLSYELTPMMKDYAVLVSKHSTGNAAALTDAIIQFSRKYGLRFTDGSSPVSYLDAYPGSPELANQLFRIVTDFYQKSIDTATIGASGAVFGILAAFVYLFPNTYIYLYFLVPVKAKWLGLIYFSYEVFYAIQNSAGDNVARWAHIGGAIVGLLIVMTWNKKNRKTFY
jgi:membrane associated rhomboid family serine protease